MATLAPEFQPDNPSSSELAIPDLKTLAAASSSIEDVSGEVPTNSAGQFDLDQQDDGSYRYL